MSINFGLYDFFSFLIPGLLYIFTFGKLLVDLGWNYSEGVPWESVASSNIIILLPVVAFAYVVGHIMDVIANGIFLRSIRTIRNRFTKILSAEVKALAIQKKVHSELDIKFGEKDWFLLFNLIGQRNISLSQYIDKYQADSIMLRNISFGGFLLAVFQIFGNLGSLNLSSFVIAISSLLISYVAYIKSEDFRMWFFSSIFEASLEYGLSLEDVVKYNHMKHENIKNRK